MTDVPTPIQLEPRGHYILPAAEAFLGLTIVGGRLPAQLLFVLEDGSELRLPISEFAQDKLLRQCALLYEASSKKTGH